METYIERFNTIKEQWRRFLQGQPVDKSIINPDILEAWQRCKANNVDPYLRKVPVVLGEKELEQRRQANRDLIKISRPFAEHLYGFVRGSNFVVALSDAEGYLIDLLGDVEVLESVKRGNFVLGACWSEEVAGSNGVGTALKLGKPLQVFGYEHYCINSYKWTCSGAPVRDPEGIITGAIDMTGPFEMVNPHTLGMVVACALAIENEIRLNKALCECRFADSFQKTVISSIPEIILALDNEGTITLINDNARKLFGNSAGKYVGRNIHNFWGTKNAAVVDMINRRDSVTDVEVRISLRNGVTDFTLTCSPIVSMNEVTGRLVILNEIKRARTLAARMMGAKAKLHFEHITGQDPDFLETVRQAEIAARMRSNVLLLGESGTGKDVFAQSIHNGSDRKDGPYVAINCATIPRDLISCELFGYSDGAFTGSRKGGNQGKFELADGGTIFLDEIAETPFEFQAALLRVMEDKCVLRVGGSNCRMVDVRMIAATNKDLKEQVRKGNFREDLYYRLNVFTIHMVPLRQRKEDILLLAETFVEDMARLMGKKILGLDQVVLDRFMDYHWPGNVRELQNIIERMIHLAHGDRLTEDLLPSEIANALPARDMSQDIEPIDKMEQEMILKLLASSLTKKEIAKKLGMSRSTLYRKLERYSIAS